MKKYKPTGGKKYVPTKDRLLDDTLTETSSNAITDASEVQESPENQAYNSVFSRESEVAINEEPTSVDHHDTLVEDHQEKPKKRLWSPLNHKEAATKIIPQSISSAKTAEEEREPMQPNTNSGLNSVSVSEPSAVISKLMVITGDVKLDTKLLLAGKVTGHIYCDDQIEVQNDGVVEGNITAKSIKLSGGKITGNITCEGTVETDKDTVINGNISASVIVISGKVTGEIRAKESVMLSSTAVIKGDLYSAAISVEKGALLEGKYSVTSSLE